MRDVFIWLSKTDPLIVYGIGWVALLSAHLMYLGARTLTRSLSPHTNSNEAPDEHPQENTGPEQTAGPTGTMDPEQDGDVQPSLENRPTGTIIVLEEVQDSLSSPGNGTADVTKPQDPGDLELWHNLEYLLSEDGDARAVILLPVFPFLKHVSQGKDICMVGIGYWSPTDPGGIFVSRRRYEDDAAFREACSNPYAWREHQLVVGTSGRLTSWSVMLHSLLVDEGIQPRYIHSELGELDSGRGRSTRRGNHLVVKLIPNARKAHFLLTKRDPSVDIVLLPSPLQGSPKVLADCYRLTNVQLYHPIPTFKTESGSLPINPFTSLQVPANVMVARKSELAIRPEREYILDEIQTFIADLKKRETQSRDKLDFALKVPVNPYLTEVRKRRVASNLNHLSEYMHSLGLLKAPVSIEQLMSVIYDDEMLGVAAPFRRGIEQSDQQTVTPQPNELIYSLPQAA